MSYHWPGNVRELENCMERAVLTASDDCIYAHNLPPSLQSVKSSFTRKAEGSTLEVMLDNFERDVLNEYISRNNGKLSAAGKELGLSPRMMTYRMKRLGINK
jgi:Nif-specific regulatory protein